MHSAPPLPGKPSQTAAIATAPIGSIGQGAPAQGTQEVEALDILSAEDVLRMADANGAVANRKSPLEPEPVELSTQDLEDIAEEEDDALALAANNAVPDDELATQKRPSLSESQAALALESVETDDQATERRPTLSPELAAAHIAQTDAAPAAAVTSTAKMPAYVSDSRIPSSIAPMALDADTPVHRGVSMATMKLRVDAGLPEPLSRRAVAGIIAGCTLLGLLCTASLGAYALRGHNNVQSAHMGLVATPPTGELLPSPAAAPQTPEAEVAPLPEPPAPVVIPVAPAPAKAATPPAKPSALRAAPPHNTTHTTTTAHPPKPAVGSPAPALAPAPAPKVAPALGSVRLPAGNSAAEVDGNVQRATGGVLTLSCGKHRIKVAGRPSRLLDVPCGKQIAL